MSEYSVAELVQKIPSRFQPDAAEGVDIVIQFMIDDADDFFIDIAKQSCSAEIGEHDDPNLTLLTDMTTVHDVLNGRIGGMSAFLKGRLKAEGNVRLASNLSKYFKKSS
ncbi:MAG: SCP2 sterol-binding domain-containing protein [Pontibacterium sp.]